MQTSQQLNSMSPEDQLLKSLSADFLDLLDRGQAFSDVTFNVEDRHVYAHRCILAARSPFFRTLFCGDTQLMNSAQPRSSLPSVIRVGIVSYDVFMLLLQFLYSGNCNGFFSPQISGRQCKVNSCWHSSCSSAVKFGLELLDAVSFFGLEQLSIIIQTHLGAIAEKASTEDLMRMLIAARYQMENHLWKLCSKVVAKSGLTPEILHKYLPAEIVGELESIRQRSGYALEASSSGNDMLENKTKLMQKALNSSDVELVRLMVMEEGLILDKAFALHYAVNNCSRKVVETLLKVGAANVNLQDQDGETPLHMAAKLGDPEMIALLLDHEANPLMQSVTGATAMDIVQSGAAGVQSAGGYNSKSDQVRFRLCVELLQSAALSYSPPLQVKATRVEIGSPVSIRTEHGSSTLLPDECDNDYHGSMSRMVGGSTQGIHFGNRDVYSSFTHGQESQRERSYPTPFQSY
ncbi:BTB/POZ domain and ankyrin repeat-containing protein NBCL isoform X2 [Physcomitrium patens]|uniref:BTB domain-containing protein n=1 Tax=Physcomitrium patens TaxID=3218 RepID=A0A7I4AQN4_PHYPA|nr:regulatory protein NPR6-like isoform X2 [Physcomitrium patens]|eukprot:XP_024394421.1 regulatory protein NPR6-like isoform X2 [Physcomitrella patens]